MDSGTSKPKMKADQAAVLRAQSDDLTVSGEENFPSGCRFSPDGSCLLTYTAGDSKLRLYNTPATSQVEENSLSDSIVAAPNLAWKAALFTSGGNAVRSYDWYPHMKSSEPASCCFVAAARNQPVHLYDAYTGSVRASYRPYNALDELESPVVATFNHSGTKIATGGFRTDRTLHVFDVAVPGRESTVLRLGKTRRSTDGQKGMASAMAYARDDNYLAVGTYAPGSIYVYDCRQERPSGTVMSDSCLCIVGHGRNYGRKKRRLAVLENAGERNQDEDPEFTNAVDEPSSSWISSAKTKWYQTRVQGGVTQLRFSPREHYLFSVSRRSGAVLKWDLRVLSDSADHASVPVAGIASYATSNSTNQRLEFDVDDTGELLMVGGADGKVRIYSTTAEELMGSIEVGGMDAEPANGVSFSRAGNRRLLAVASGARRFPSDDEFDHDGEPIDSPGGKPSCPPGYLRLFELSNLCMTSDG